MAAARKKRTSACIDNVECFAAEAGVCKGCVEKFSSRGLSPSEKKADEEIVSDAAKAAHKKKAKKPVKAKSAKKRKPAKKPAKK